MFYGRRTFGFSSFLLLLLFVLTYVFITKMEKVFFALCALCFLWLCRLVDAETTQPNKQKKTHRRAHRNSFTTNNTTVAPRSDAHTRTTTTTFTTSQGCLRFPVTRLGLSFKCWPPKNGYRGTTPEVDEWRTLVETEETASRETESCEEVQRVCRDGNRWSRH